MSELDLIKENSHLRREVVRLRAKVDAFERSRWLRLHPRRLSGGLVRSVRAARHEPPSTTSQAPPSTPDPDPIVARFREEVVEHGLFSAEWFVHNIGLWEPILRELDGRSSELLEIGSFEGLGSSYLLWRLPDAQLTCIDTFEGTFEQVTSGVLLTDLEQRFDHNVALVGASRVRKLVGDSRKTLPQLIEERRSFDLVYVDGSHHALDVLTDAAHAWRLLAPGGIVIFDDYTWQWPGSDPLLRTGPAIDAFLDVVSDSAEPLFKERQVAVRKTG